MKAIKIVRELINGDNLSLSFSSELEKSITKKASEERQSNVTEEKKSMQNVTHQKLKKRKFKIPFARKNKDIQKETKIPVKKNSFNSGNGKYAGK